MKLIIILLVFLLCSPIALSQSKPSLKNSGTFGFAAKLEKIKWDKILEDKNQLLLIGESSLQILDLATRKVVSTRPIALPSHRAYSEYLLGWPISPDGRRMLIVGHRDAKVGEKQTAWIWDLETGKRLTVLDQMPGNVRYGYWSGNGKTLITFDRDWDTVFTRKLGVTFWDGETFEYRNTVLVENITWWHLSEDGERFFAASGRAGNLLGVKYVRDNNGVINAWRTDTGQLEKTISVADGSFSPKTREISVSPDDRFLLFIKKHKKNDTENRLLAWEMNGSVHPMYELKPNPKIDDSRIEFSPDGKYFALDVGKNLQVYETATGRRRAELKNVELPDGWLTDDVLLRVQYKPKNFFKMGKMLSTFDAQHGKVLFRQRLEYEETTLHDWNGESAGSETVDDTTVVANPRRDLFVTQSDEYVKLFDSRTGELLQTVVAPEVVYDKNNKPKLKHGTTVLKAKWSPDGKTLCIFSADQQSVSLWGLVEN